MLSVGWACAWAVCAPVWVVLWGGGGGVYLPQTGCAQVRCLALGAGHSGWTVKESETMLHGERSPGRGGGGLCPILEKVPTSPLHPVSCRQAAAHATTRHTLSRTCWGHTHSQTGWWKHPHSGRHWHEPMSQAAPKKRGPCATPGTHPPLPPP